MRETLRRSTTMTDIRNPNSGSCVRDRAGYHTITPYLTVKRAEQLVEFVKQAFGAIEVFRTIGSAGGLHAEVTNRRIQTDDWWLRGGWKKNRRRCTSTCRMLMRSTSARWLPAPPRWKSRSISFTAIAEAGVKDRERQCLVDCDAQSWGCGDLHSRGHASGDALPALRSALGVYRIHEAGFSAEEVSRRSVAGGMIHHAVVRIGDSMIETG